jgi:hypothetical protein
MWGFRKALHSCLIIVFGKVLKSLNQKNLWKPENKINVGRLNHFRINQHPGQSIFGISGELSGNE